MMLHEVKLQLDDLNYFTQIRSGTLIVGTNPVQDSTFPEIGTFQAFCSVEVEGDGLVVEYGKTNLPKEAKCSSVDETVHFITGLFPL